MYLYLSLSLSPSLSLSLSLSIDLSIWLSACTHSIYIYIYVYTNVYIYIYLFISTHTCIPFLHGLGRPALICVGSLPGLRVSFDPFLEGTRFGTAGRLEVARGHGVGEWLAIRCFGGNASRFRGFGRQQQGLSMLACRSQTDRKIATLVVKRLQTSLKTPSSKLHSCQPRPQLSLLCDVFGLHRHLFGNGSGTLT